MKGNIECNICTTKERPQVEINLRNRRLFVSWWESYQRVEWGAKPSSNSFMLVLPEWNTFIVQIRCSYLRFLHKRSKWLLEKFEISIGTHFSLSLSQNTCFLGAKLSATRLVISVCVECCDQSIIWWRVLFKFTHASCDPSNKNRISFKTRVFLFWKVLCEFVWLCFFLLFMRCLYHVLRLRKFTESRSS